jgi:hypothetical protein
MPDLLHVIPVGDDAVLNGVLEGQNTSLGLGLVSDVRVLLAHTHHDTLEMELHRIRRQFRVGTLEKVLTWCLGRPTMDGKTALGASSPAKPALHMPEPLSTTKAATSSSHILDERSSFFSDFNVLSTVFIDLASASQS